MKAGNVRKAAPSLNAQLAALRTMLKDARHAAKARAEARSGADVYVEGKLRYRNGELAPRSDVEPWTWRCQN